MTFFSKRFLLPAALLVCATDAALAAPLPQQIRILCDAPERRPVCDGLRTAIADRFPDQQVVLANDVTATGTTVIRFVAQLAHPDAIAGHLTWTLADGQTGESRPLEMSVMDTAVTDQMLRDFGATLATLYAPNS